MSNKVEIRAQAQADGSLSWTWGKKSDGPNTPMGGSQSDPSLEVYATRENDYTIEFVSAGGSACQSATFYTKINGVKTSTFRLDGTREDTIKVVAKCTDSTGESQSSSGYVKVKKSG